jgi:hypothetical protein
MKETYHNAGVDDSKANRVFHAEIRVDNTIQGANWGHRGRAERVVHRSSVAARICLDLSIRLGLGQSTEWRDHVVFPC